MNPAALSSLPINDFEFLKFQRNIHRSMITRRNFLKGTALGMGALALSDQILDFKSWAKTNAESPVIPVPTLCNGCGNRCAIYAHVKNNRIWKIEGNPEANGNRGFICPKGHGYIHDLYNPQR
ncbi:MAG: twin-arginine translocation signal domain-containing protein, partial [Deltaproteobacteria bacterium]|nr:twin-arginine translocation signal domain-containing protein [Deltaproteobacteria bacterium]